MPGGPHDVRPHRASTNRIQHPQVGDLEFEFGEMGLPVYPPPGQMLCADTNHPGSAIEELIALLGNRAATSTTPRSRRAQTDNVSRGARPCRPHPGGAAIVRRPQTDPGRASAGRFPQATVRLPASSYPDAGGTMDTGDESAPARSRSRRARARVADVGGDIASEALMSGIVRVLLFPLRALGHAVRLLLEALS